MSDPLNAAAVNTTRPVSWEKFDEISMGSPNQEETKPKVAHEESIDIEDGRHSAAAEARLEIEDNQDRAAVVTPLPTNEIIADVSKLGQAPVVSVSQDYGLDVITKDNVILTPGGVELVNGRRLATIYPENSGCAWIVPPRYEPTCMPAILAAEGIALPGEDYITAMELITNDYRFRSFSTLYSRMIAGWMTMSVVILLVVLFTNTQGGVPVMIFCFVWIFMLFAGIVGCAIIRKQIRIGLRHCVHSANKILVKHNLVVGIEDKGQLSCHKVVIHFLWFKISDCLPDLERLIRIEASGGAVVFGGQAHAAPAKEMTKTEIADKALQLVLKYSQGYVKDTVKHRLIFPSRPTHGVSDYSPKHCRRQYCVCQYIDKKHFNRPPKKWMAIVLLMGLPGAGKTTLAQKLLCQLPSSILFNMDELAGRKVDNFNAHKSRKEFELAVRRHLEATPFHQTKTIIVDDIFYLKSMRRPFERMARAHGLQLIVVFLKVDFQTARARNKTRGNDQLPEETIRRIFEEMELSANCFPFTNFQDLVHKIEEAKRTEPKSSEESERQPPTLAEINEKALRRCVKLMIDEGADGKRLGMVKKKIWTKIKRAGVVLEEEEVKHLLRDEYRL